MYLPSSFSQFSLQKRNKRSRRRRKKDIAAERTSRAHVANVRYNLVDRSNVKIYSREGDLSQIYDGRPISVPLSLFHSLAIFLPLRKSEGTLVTLCRRDSRRSVAERDEEEEFLRSKRWRGRRNLGFVSADQVTGRRARFNSTLRGKRGRRERSMRRCTRHHLHNSHL